MGVLWRASNMFVEWLLIVSSLIYLGIAAFVPYSVDSTPLNWWAHVAGFVVPVVISILSIHFCTEQL